MLITIDDYYDVQFYNECIQALKNNGVEFKEFISIKPPFNFYFEVENAPTFINYDEVPDAYSRFLANIVKALKPNDDYIYERRESYTNKKAIEHYAVNDALRAGQQSGQGIFFISEKDEVLKLSKDYPRKIYFMGKYFNRKYKIFFTDNLIIKNLLRPDQILVDSNKFTHVTDLETELNFKIFREKDRLVKLSQTPYILKGQFYPIPSVRPEITDTYVLS